MKEKMEKKIKFGEPFTPMKPMYSDLDLGEIIEAHGGKTNAEIKEDGYRCLAHVDGDFVKLYTRQHNEYIPQCFPEIIKALQGLKLKKTIIDSELVGTKRKYAGFNQIKKRFRARLSQKGLEEYIHSGIIENCPVELVVFDTLMWEGKPAINKPLEERRILTEGFAYEKINHSTMIQVTTQGELEEIYQKFVEREKHEGFVLKDPKSPHRIDCKTSVEWVKLKKFETLDLLIVGFYSTPDSQKKGLPFSAVLCATYNEKTGFYETIGKVSVNKKNPFSGNLLAIDLYEMVKGNIANEKPKGVLFSGKMADAHEPSMYIKDTNQSAIMEIKAMNIQKSSNWLTCGIDNEGKAYSMRIGWAKQIREDKSKAKDKKTQVSPTSLVAKIFKNQEAKE